MKTRSIVLFLLSVTVLGVLVACTTSQPPAVQTVIVRQTVVVPARNGAPRPAETRSAAVRATETSAAEASSAQAPIAASTTVPAPDNQPTLLRDKIKHILVIMQENRSFDTYFGTYPGVDGIPMQNGQPTVCSRIHRRSNASSRIIIQKM